MASEVAALIGMHCYSQSLHALVRCWRRSHPASLRRWERATGGVVLPEAAFQKYNTYYMILYYIMYYITYYVIISILHIILYNVIS